MNLKIQIDEKDTKTVVHLSGEIDVYTAPQLKEALLPLTDKEGHILEVNLAQVTYMDSTGLGVFIHALKSSKEYGCKLTLTQLQDRVLRLFEITGLQEIMDINSTIRGVDN